MYLQRHQTRPVRLVSLCLLVVLLLLALPRPAAAYEQAVQPTVAAPGSVFAFFATGFEPEEWVYYWVNDPTTRVYRGGAVRVNEAGRADWTWASPHQAEHGQWSMVALGKESHELRVIFFEIAPVVANPDSPTPAGQEQYDAAVTPARGAPGTEFDLFGRGFHDVERVVFWGTDPQGRVYELGAFGSNENGRVDWTWKSPPYAPPGVWTIRMQGDKSQVERIVTLEILHNKDFPEIAEPVDTYDSAVTPKRGTPGTWFTFFATNFQEFEDVDYTITDPLGIVHKEHQVHANSRGRVDWEWTAPDEAIPGTWRLNAEGKESHRVRVITFEIYLDRTDPADVPDCEKAVTPGDGTPGTTFWFFATGYDSKEPVDYQVLDPSGQLVVDASLRASKHGRADWQYETPDDALPGVWRTVATGRDSHVRCELTFTVR